MGALFHGRYGHKTAVALHDYELLDQVGLGFGKQAVCRRGDGTFLKYVGRDEVMRLGAGQSLNGHQLRRPHRRQKQGEGLTFTLPHTAVAAMKERGLLMSPHSAFQHLDSNVVRAMKELNRHAYGRTTEWRHVRMPSGRVIRKRVIKRVKVSLYYLLYKGFRTRSGEAAPQVTVFVLNTGRAKDGKYYALDWRPLYNAQQQTQSTWHLGVAHDLGRHAGIKCVPHRHAFRALGIDPRVKPQRTLQIESDLKARNARGPHARSESARRTRAAKPSVSWDEAVKNLAYRVTGAVSRKVTQLKKGQERRHAARCVRAAVIFCRDNSLTFTTRDVLAAAAHLAMPHVSPATFVRQFKAEMARAESLGVDRVKDLGRGQFVFSSHTRVLKERRAVAALAAGSLRKTGRLTTREVSKALAGRVAAPRQFERVGKLAEKGGVTIDKDGLFADPLTRKGLIEAYQRNKRPVHFVGKSLGNNAYSAKEFASALTRTSRLTSLWRGLRSPGCLWEKLKVAEHIYRHGHTKLKKRALVVADVGLNNAAELRQIAQCVKKAKGHLVLVGQAAKELAPRVDMHLQELSRGVKL